MLKTWLRKAARFAGHRSRAEIVQAILGLACVAIVIVLLACPKPWQYKKIDSVEDFARAFGWWAALLNLIPLGLLALSAKRWLLPLPRALPFHSAAARPRGFVAVVAAAMLVCAGLGTFRLGDSLWGDEAYSVRQDILGGYRVKDGVVSLKPISWPRTLWYYEKPTNHIFQSILSRLSLTAWRSVARPSGLQVSETAVRLPVYVAGILSVGTLALLVARLGLPWAGALAAWLLALHPWHLRLITEARGYGLVIFLIPLACLAALRALENGAWKWWAALAAVEFAALYTWPPSALVMAILNLGILIRLLSEEKFAPSLKILLARWMVTQTAAAIVFLQLFLPCIPQVTPYLKSVFGFFSHPFWLKNVGALFLTGSLWTKSGKLDTPYMEYLPHATAHPLLFRIAIALALAFLVLGAIRLWRSGPPARWLVPVLALPGPIFYGFAALRDKYLYEWYLSFMLPGLAALVAVGALGILQPWRNRPALHWIGPVWAALVVLGFFALSHPARNFLLTRSAQYGRESVLLTRPTLDFNFAENRNILTTATTQLPDTYDPRARRAGNLEAYAAIMREADARDLPLYVNNGYPGALRLKSPEIAALLDDPAVFDLVSLLTGTEEMLDRVVYKYRPGALKNANFERYKGVTYPKELLPPQDYYYY